MKTLEIKELSDMPKGLNGLIINESIYINKKLSNVDKGYVLAHELMHYLLHTGDTINSDDYKKIEEQANRGAIRLLTLLGINEDSYQSL